MSVKDWIFFTIWMAVAFIISHWIVYDAIHLQGIVGTLVNWGIAGAITLYGWRKYIRKAVSGISA